MPLQPITEKNLNLVRKWRNNPSVRANMYSSHEITEKEHLEWFELIQLDTSSLWFMHYSEENEPDGVVYFTQYDEVSKTAFWGFYTDPSSKPGAGLRLGLDALNYAFLDLKLHKLNSDTLGKNISSKRFHEKFGFQQEGFFRDYHFVDNKYHDVVRLGILASEWFEKKNEVKHRIDQHATLHNMRGGGTIMILTDSNSWLEPYLLDWAEDLMLAGYQCYLGHKPKDARDADFCFCLSFGQILPKYTLDKYKHTLVVHESDLPKGRGWAPMAWQIIEGQNTIVVTLLEAVAHVDAGKIYDQKIIELNGTELSHEWRKLQADKTLELCNDWLTNYPQSALQTKQQVGQPSYYKKRTPIDSELDPTKTLAAQFDLLRVVDNTNYPAFFSYKGERYNLRINKQVS